jgi:hypothetical protein
MTSMMITSTYTLEAVGKLALESQIIAKVFLPLQVLVQQMVTITGSPAPGQ